VNLDDFLDGALDNWETRDSLSRIRTYARARYTAPWAVLGAVLARVVACTDPSICLPPTIGSRASLNLFVALVGRPGSGKDTAQAVAEELLDYPQGVDTIPLGSGEGLAHIYKRRVRSGKDLVTEQYRDRALVTIGEIDAYAALASRQGSTLAGQLRQAAMGQQLGFFYVDPDKRMMVDPHSYRMCLIAGVQPGRGGVLLGDADGGTPQRFVWLPATDPDMPDDPGPAPAPLRWKPPMYSGPVDMHLPESARREVIDAHLGRQRGDGDALDGHALLTRCKVAAALALLEDRPGGAACRITEADWSLSGWVMRRSDRVRQGMADELARQAAAGDTARGRSDARRAMAGEDVRHERQVERLVRRVLALLVEAGDEGMTVKQIRGRLPGRDRGELAPVLDLLAADGRVRCAPSDRGHRYSV